MTNLRSSVLVSFSYNATLLHQREGILNFPFLLKHEDREYSDVFDQLLNPVEILLQAGETTLILVKSQSYTDNKATDILQASHILESAEDLFICGALPTIHNLCYNEAISLTTRTISKKRRT